MAVAQSPRSAERRYLLGCAHWDAQLIASGARCFMWAYRLEPRLQSAALLAFAGLAWSARPADPLLAVLRDTWEEFRRPTFDVQPIERRLFDAHREPAPDFRDAQFERRLFRLPLRSLREQLRAEFPTLTSHAATALTHAAAENA